MATPASAEFTRPALAPGILGALVLFAGLALLDSDGYLFIRFGVCILAVICAVFAAQARQWWWLVPLAAIAVVWNPAWVLELHGQGWVAGQFIAAIVMIASGVLIKVRPSAS
ncbi:DUF6804 family protein [Salinibacterium hongtaonis]|uniref:Uncharacterized protein n=1 Tax=Homoserinimonas hongtaonis TaxID=2079791 RepID=A0A2U1SXE9_9MICO|nr:DUF6804 family protein [Salinibacterium hongtaonis]AWB88878.1 hypothetical protein C2138_04330 [Salinibacterium hongtaonis]PWB96276.1 hypothetical protein DF220_13040 [Salinibacterium hongtaonis]